MTQSTTQTAKDWLENYDFVDDEHDGKIICLALHLDMAGPDYWEVEEMKEKTPGGTISVTLNHSSIKPTSYDDENTFVVGERQTRWGTGPEEVKERVKLVREALKLVAPECLDYNSDRWELNYHRAKALRNQYADADKARKAIRWPILADAHPIVPARVREERKNHRGKVVLPRKEYPEHINFRGRRANRPACALDLDNTVGDLRVRIQACINAEDDLIKAQEAALEEIRDTAQDYREITARISRHEEANELTKIGLHDLVNALYYLIDPNSAEYEQNKRYRAMLKQAWDGQEVEDTREWHTVNSGEWLILNDEDADKLWEEQLRNICEEVYLPDLPEAVRPYFDIEKWIEDAKADGRGHTLSGYDGQEIELDSDFSLDGDSLFAYRIN